MIIIGYQGIGKSTLASSRTGYIDLESSCFFFEKEGMIIRDPDWYKMYCNVAMDLSKQGFNVFTSSHKQVRDYLMKNSKYQIVMAVVPSIDLKDQWIKKLEKRYRQSEFTKDYKAWKNAEDRYEENIKEIMDDIPNTCIIEDMRYHLGTVISNYIDSNFK